MEKWQPTAIQTPHYVIVVGLLFLVTHLLQRTMLTIVAFEMGDSNLMRSIPMKFQYGIMGHILQRAVFSNVFLIQLTLNRHAGLGNVKPCNSNRYLTPLWFHSMKISTWNYISHHLRLVVCVGRKVCGRQEMQRWEPYRTVKYMVCNLCLSITITFYKTVTF